MWKCKKYKIQAKHTSVVKSIQFCIHNTRGIPIL